MKVRWTDFAITQLEAIQQYIAQSSPEYALRTVERIVSRSEQIGSFPASGRMVPEYESPEIREVVEGPYRLVYRLRPDALEVLAVIHGARGTLPLG